MNEHYRIGSIAEDMIEEERRLMKAAAEAEVVARGLRAVRPRLGEEGRETWARATHRAIVLLLEETPKLNMAHLLDLAGFGSE
jgi:phosphoribosyl-ATP pyrophosphohydrolase